VVIPQWNVCEQLLSDDITFRTKETKKKLSDALDKLHFMFDEYSIFSFMRDHLRFPNMKVTVIDYPNANFLQRLTLDLFRKQQGIPTPK